MSFAGGIPTSNFMITGWSDMCGPLPTVCDGRWAVEEKKKNLKAHHHLPVPVPVPMFPGKMAPEAGGGYRVSRG
jgi:hypothetical protein